MLLAPTTIVLYPLYFRHLKCPGPSNTGSSVDYLCQPSWGGEKFSAFFSLSAALALRKRLAGQNASNALLPSQAIVAFCHAGSCTCTASQNSNSLRFYCYLDRRLFPSSARSGQTNGKRILPRRRIMGHGHFNRYRRTRRDLREGRYVSLGDNYSTPKSRFGVKTVALNGSC